MSDYRDRNDPLYGNTSYEPVDSRGGTVWSWIAGAAVLVIVVAALWRCSHEPSRVASNGMQSTTRIAPPPMTTPVLFLYRALRPPQHLRRALARSTRR